MEQLKLGFVNNFNKSICQNNTNEKFIKKNEIIQKKALESNVKENDNKNNKKRKKE